MSEISKVVQEVDSRLAAWTEQPDPRGVLRESDPEI